MKRSLRDLPIDGVIDMGVFKINKISLFPCCTFIPKTVGIFETGLGLPETDMGLPETDMGLPETDMGLPETDMGLPETDMGLPETGMGVLKTGNSLYFVVVER